MTANIENEVLTLVEFIQPLFTWMRAQSLPASYKPDGCVVRYLDSDQESETFAHDRFDREYQIIVMASNELACLRYIDQVQKQFTGVHSLKLKDSTRYLRVGSLSFSPPFLTEDKIVFAAVGILHAQARAAKEVEKASPMGCVVINFDGEEILNESRGNANG